MSPSRRKKKQKAKKVKAEKPAYQMEKKMTASGRSWVLYGDFTASLLQQLRVFLPALLRDSVRGRVHLTHRNFLLLRRNNHDMIETPGTTGTLFCFGPGAGHAQTVSKRGIVHDS